MIDKKDFPGTVVWNDIECKQARKGVPQDAYKTVSAFSNTNGGYLVFGVKDSQGKLDIVGVIEVDKVQNDFLSSIRSVGKLNRSINIKEDALEHDGKTLLVFHIPEAGRKEKPVYLNNDIRESFIRRGAGDERCTGSEIERFLRDASDTTYDREHLKDINVDNFFDKPCVAWYRRLFQEKEHGRDAELKDIDFLTEWGFIVEVGESLVATRAAVLLFGKERYVRQILPRGVVDYQRIDIPFKDWSPDLRWHDRVIIEGNIIHAWQMLVEKYMRLADRPFSIDMADLRRHDDPPDFISFREAAINLLIHQDYGDHTRKPVIKIFPDRTLFWNPGDAYDSIEQLLNPTEKEVRNPAIVSALRRVGLSDQAGTGMRSIIKNWREIGRVPPLIRNDKPEKSFELILPKDRLVTEEQILFQTRLGVTLTEEETIVFAYACRSHPCTITNAKTIFGGGTQEIRTVLDRLVIKGLLYTVRDGELWDIAGHLKESLHNTHQHSTTDTNLVTDQLDDFNKMLPTVQVKELVENLVTKEVDQIKTSLITDQAERPEIGLVTPVLTGLTEDQRKMVQLCETPRKQADLMKAIGLAHRVFFKKKYLEPLVQTKLIRMTHPDKPTHPDQAYVVTETGLRLLALWKDEAENGKSAS